MSFGLLHRVVLWWNANSYIHYRPSVFWKANTALLGGHLAYAYGTSEDSEITIRKKYSFVENGFTKFMIQDFRNQHYCVNNSLWFWKWDCIEDWSKLEEGESYRVKRYGWRVPILSLFPNIVRLEGFIPKTNDFEV